MALSSSLILLSFIMSGWILNGAYAQKTWCVAKPSSDPATLQNNINYACAHVDCQILHKGCPCNSPDNLFNHASIAMNLYYQCRGRNPWNCHFANSALVTITDPSYGDKDHESFLHGFGNGDFPNPASQVSPPISCQV